MQILIATTNAGKFNEMIEVLDDLHHEFLSLEDLNIYADVDETGHTYEENALIKAKYFHNLSGLPTIGEDSGIMIDALQGELGLHTRRWGAGKDASDQEWVDYFLERMNEFKHPEQRGAKFISTAVFYSPKHENEHYVVTGETPGLITEALEAPIIKGIPISSCFVPNGADKVYAQMSQHEKNQLSHRGKAMKQLRQYLAQIND